MSNRLRVGQYGKYFVRYDGRGYYSIHRCNQQGRIKKDTCITVMLDEERVRRFIRYNQNNK